jgi:WD40 repeat protein
MSYLTEEEQQEKDRSEKRRFSRQQIIEHIKKSLLFTIFDVKWIPRTASFLTIGQYPNNNGALSIFQLENNELKVMQEVRKTLPLKCGTLSHSTGDQLATGDFAGALQLWDLERTDKPVTEFKKAHESIINAIDGSMYTGPPEIATCSRDGCVRVWDPREKSRPIVSLNPVDATRARDCWSVRFGNSFNEDERVIAAGYDNGDVKLFDLRTQKMVQEFNVGNGVCDVEFDRPDIEMNKLVCSTLEGRIRAYDLRTLHPKLGYAYVEERVSSGTVWSGRTLPQNRDVFMCGGAGELTLCKYVYPPERAIKDMDGTPKGVAGTVEELNKVKVGDQPINSLDWHKQREGLLVCSSFDQTVRVMLVTKLNLVN